MTFFSFSKESIFSKGVYENNRNLTDERFHTNSLEEMVELFSLKPEAHRSLQKFSAANNIIFCSSAFSKEEVDLLIDALKETTRFFKK